MVFLRRIKLRSRSSLREANASAENRKCTHSGSLYMIFTERRAFVNGDKRARSCIMRKSCPVPVNRIFPSRFHFQPLYIHTPKNAAQCILKESFHNR
jgi:hypothetical protein